MRATLALMIGTLAVAACSEHPPEGTPVAGGARASAALLTPAGASVGHATASDVAGGVRITVDARGLPAGSHGLHIHTTGRCDPPDFASAGPHWNPTGAKHGTMNPAGPHRGDLPNLLVDTGGRGTAGAVIPGATLAELLDPDGAALVIHAGADDLQTDPSGSSGARVACGVFGAG